MMHAATFQPRVRPMSVDRTREHLQAALVAIVVAMLVVWLAVAPRVSSGSLAVPAPMPSPPSAVASVPAQTSGVGQFVTRPDPKPVPDDRG